MGVPTVETFLFAFSLETGGLIIGWIVAMISAFCAISLAAFLITTMCKCCDRHGVGGFVTIQGIFINFILFAVVCTSAIVFCVYFLLLFIASIELIHGIDQVSGNAWF